jgi:triacylglycerol esterase/lipase EstA (alpha/beta hydrolase family)
MSEAAAWTEGIAAAGRVTWREARRLGCATGRAARDLVAKVNPDVYREAGFTAIQAYSLVLPRREAVRALPSDGFPPLVLVHGLGGNRGTWLPLRLFLRALGRRRVYAFGYEQGTIQEHAERLAAFVGEVLAATGEPRADVVAHSLGGIVARYAVQRLGLAAKVGTLVTLASPHGGTYAACYANTALTRALRPDSAVLADLNAGDPAAFPVRLVAVYSDRDVYVVPKERMTHPAAENLFLPGLSHTQHLVSARVFRAVAEALRGGA